MPTPKQLTLKVLRVTACDAGGKPYTFRALELPTGECVVPYESTHDGWFTDRDSIDASGCDLVEAVEDTRETREWTEADVRKSVSGSAGEFGSDAVPASLRRLIAVEQE